MAAWVLTDWSNELRLKRGRVVEVGNPSGRIVDCGILPICTECDLRGFHI